MRCPTKHGDFQCDREAGHKGECETEQRPDTGPRVACLLTAAEVEAVRNAKVTSRKDT